MDDFVAEHIPPSLDYDAKVLIGLLNESFTHAVMITGFVFIMMRVIEYLNVLTGGLWQKAFGAIL